jgi:hypothetical protein
LWVPITLYSYKNSEFGHQSTYREPPCHAGSKGSSICQKLVHSKVFGRRSHRGCEIPTRRTQPEIRQLDVSSGRLYARAPLNPCLRTYDEYISELSSGRLSWSPVHNSDAFWRENAAKLNEKDSEGVKYVPVVLFTRHPNTQVQNPREDPQGVRRRISVGCRCA